MQKIEIKRRQVELSQYVKRSAKESDYNTLITEDCLVTENGEPRIYYGKLDNEKTKYIRQAVKNIRYRPP